MPFVWLNCDSVCGPFPCETGGLWQQFFQLSWHGGLPVPLIDIMSGVINVGEATMVWMFLPSKIGNQSVVVSPTMIS